MYCYYSPSSRYSENIDKFALWLFSSLYLLTMPIILGSFVPDVPYEFHSFYLFSIYVCEVFSGY